VEHIQRVSDGGLTGGLALRAGKPQSLEQSRTRIRHGVLKIRDEIEVRGPRDSLAIGGDVAGDPAETVRLDTHQNRLLTGEDFIKRALDNQRPSRLIQHFQHRRSLRLSRLRTPPQRTYRRCEFACKIFKSR
jgi:hypothetical protein